MSFQVFVSTVITDGNKIFLVTEKKEKNFGKLNLPGGHLELWETVMQWAIRECREEISVDVALDGIIAINHSGEKNTQHYIFNGHIISEEPQANPMEVLDGNWYDIDALDELPDEAFLGHRRFRAIIERVKSGKVFPIDIITDISY